MEENVENLQTFSSTRVFVPVSSAANLSFSDVRTVILSLDSFFTFKETKYSVCF